jgi:hypothetical protein
VIFIILMNWRSSLASNLPLLQGHTTHTHTHHRTRTRVIVCRILTWS